MEARTLILIGRTGNGKSSTGNSILGRSVFKVGFSFSSATKECQLEQTTLNDCRIINVIDTPGFFDTNTTNSKEYLQTQVAKCIDLAKDGVHGVLYVLSVKNRFTAEEASVLESLQLLFGPEIVKYVVVVFTGGDDLESDGLTLEDYLNDCQPKLHEVLRRCNMRTVLFNNKTTSETKRGEQRNELLKQVENIVCENGGKPYSNELLRQAQENQQKILCGQTRCGVSGNAFCQEEMDRIKVEHMNQLYALLQQQMQETVKTYEERLNLEQEARKEAQGIVEEALQYSEEVTTKSRKICPLNNNNTKWLLENLQARCTIS